MTDAATLFCRRASVLLVQALPRCALALLVMIAGSVALAQDQRADRGGTITGRVLYVGERLDPEPLKVERDRAFCGDTIPDESLLVDGSSRGVAATVISLDGVATEKSGAPEQRLLLENRGCRFLPRVNAVPAGTMLVISNTDPVMHNTHIRKKSRFGDNLVNVVQPHQAKVEKTLPDSGFLDVRCDAHPFMHASIHVFPHPYFAVTDSTGRFELSHVPPGKYKLRMWHETLGKQEQVVAVPDKGSVTIKFEVGPGN